MPKPPFRLSKPKTTAQKRGLSFERKVVKKVKAQFPKVIHGPWLEYQTADGKVHYCQPDALALMDGLVVVFEAKLTEVESGREKLQNLYGPLVEALYGYPTIKVLVFQNVVSKIPPGLKINPRSPILQYYLKDPSEVYSWHYV